MIIDSITQNDLYKFSQQQAAWRQYPSAYGRYDLDIRTKDPVFPVADILRDIRDEIYAMADLRLSVAEDKQFRLMPWFKDDYIDWLGSSQFRFNPMDINLTPTQEGSIRLSIKGYWHRAILYEVPVLAIIEEVYCRKVSGLTPEQSELEAIKRLKPKIEMLKSHPRLTFTDFGTRRRYSTRVHRAVLSYLKDNCPNLVGTSNVHFAREFGLKAIGTVAHEFFSAHLALVDRLDQAQKRALHVWLQEYSDQLGTALTDTFTTKAFWRDFDVVLAQAFDGVRQDSGDPFQFGLDAIAHYKKLGIDPRTKHIIFSDSLDFPKMISLFETFTGLIGVGFGIGTNLMNDVGVSPLSIVIKLMELNGKDLVKLGDGTGKTMGNPNMVRQVKEAYKVPITL